MSPSEGLRRVIGAVAALLDFDFRQHVLPPLSLPFGVIAMAS